MKTRASIVAAAAVALCCAGLAAQQAAAPQPSGGQTGGGQQQPQASPFQSPPVHVYLYGGLKTHGEGQHDYPQFLADWSKLLMNRNAVVDGGLHFPSARQLAATDVLVIYKGDAGYMNQEDRAALDAYLQRGGGVVSIHDALCGPDPADFATIVGGGKKHREVNYTLEADVPYTIVDTAHPIMQGMSNFQIKDEAFFNMTWAKSPEIHVLATATMAATPSAKGHEGEVVPQIWTYENELVPAPTGRPFRAFVWMQGHNYANFALPQVRGMLLRGIAWAAKHPADALMTERPARGRGGRGTAAGQGRGGQ